MNRGSNRKRFRVIEKSASLFEQPVLASDDR
jgi:hypothetical protein